MSTTTRFAAPELHQLLRRCENSGRSPTEPGLPVLDQLGFIEAVRALAEEAPIPVELIVEQWSSEVALSQDVEHAAYRVVASTVQHAAQTGAKFITVTVAKNHELIITIEHDGNPQAPTVPTTRTGSGPCGGRHSTIAGPDVD